MFIPVNLLNVFTIGHGSQQEHEVVFEKLESQAWTSKICNFSTQPYRRLNCISIFLLLFILVRLFSGNGGALNKL